MTSNRQPIRRAQGKQETRNKNFREEVFRQVKKIPEGKVATYGQIATKLGNPRLSRQVGWVLHMNTDPRVPCHRVVDRNGRLAPNFGGPSLWNFPAPLKSRFAGRSGAFDGWKEQKRRLMTEGVRFVDNMHINLANYL